MGDTWKIREDIPKILHGLVFKLIDVCSRKDVSNCTAFRSRFGVLPEDVYEYIKTTWSEQNQQVSTI